MAKEESKQGEENNRKGKKYENDVAKFLHRKMGLTRVTHRSRTKLGEFDLVMKKGNDLYVVEAKHLDRKVSPSTVNRFHNKIKTTEFRGGIIVAEHGLTENAEAAAKKFGIVHYKYRGAIKKSRLWLPKL